MDKQGRIIAGIVLVHSSLGILWSFWVASQIGFPIGFLTVNLALAAVGISAGIGWHTGRRWSSYLGVVFYLAQLIHVVTPTFQWSLSLGFAMNIALGWFGGGELGINLLALVMLWWMGARAFASGR